MRRAPELWWSLLALLLASLAYRGLASAELRIPSSSLGLGLGGLGLTLMLATELLYSIRKQARDRAWGPMRTWLKTHIFTGVVGPGLILLHGGWLFGGSSAGEAAGDGRGLHGLAGWAALAMLVVVASGFVGRYLYTAIPRTLEGDEVLGPQPATTDTPDDSAPSGLARRAEPSLAGATEHGAAAAAAARARQRLARTRRWLALWHTVHVPLGMSMFALALLHVAAALYFRSGLR